MIQWLIDWCFFTGPAALLLIFIAVMVYPHLAYRVDSLEYIEIGDFYWALLKTPFGRESWFSDGGGWIREETGERISHNWGGGDAKAYILNAAVWKAETIQRARNLKWQVAEECGAFEKELGE